SILESYILALNIAERTELSPDHLGPGGLTGCGTESKPANLRYLCRLLRASWNAKRKEHEAKGGDRDFFLHLFIFGSIHSSLDTSRLIAFFPMSPTRGNVTLTLPALV